MNQLKLVIFDMDGLIFDTEQLTFKARQIVAKKHGYDFQLEDYKKVIGHQADYAEKLWSDQFGEGFMQVMDESNDEYHRLLEQEGVPVKPGVHELLDILDQHQIPRCIASSSAREKIKLYLELSGLTERFDFYLSGTEVENGKPSPDIFLEACRRANVEPKNALVLEDSPTGYTAAIRAGIKCIVVPDLIKPTEEMKKGAFRVVNELGEVGELLGKESILK